MKKYHIFVTKARSFILEYLKDIKKRIRFSDYFDLVTQMSHGLCIM